MEQIQEILDILKRQHLRLTKTRKALMEIFSQNEAPLSALDILRELKKARVIVNKTTVYRELERLQAMNIVSRVELGDRKKYYELASREHHHHLICLQCECVEDVDMDENTLFTEGKKVSQEKGFTIVRHSLEFFGLCKKCSV